MSNATNAPFTVAAGIETPGQLIRWHMHRNTRQMVSDLLYALRHDCRKEPMTMGVRLEGMYEGPDGLLDGFLIVPLIEVDYGGKFLTPVYFGSTLYEEVMSSPWTIILGDDNDPADGGDMSLYVWTKLNGVIKFVKLVIVALTARPQPADEQEE